MSFMRWSIECRSLPSMTEVDKFKGKVWRMTVQKEYAPGGPLVSLRRPIKQWDPFITSPIICINTTLLRTLFSAHVPWISMLLKITHGGILAPSPLTCLITVQDSRLLGRVLWPCRRSSWVNDPMFAINACSNSSNRLVLHRFWQSRTSIDSNAHQSRQDRVHYHDWQA